MVYKELVCDNCNASERTSVPISTSLLRKIAREEGWSCGKKDLCPKCAALKKGTKA